MGPGRADPGLWKRGGGVSIGRSNRGRSPQGLGSFQSQARRIFLGKKEKRSISLSALKSRPTILGL